MIIGASQMDGAIVLVDGSQGAQEQTRELSDLSSDRPEACRGFYQQVDIADPELLDLVEMEVTDILESHGYNDPPIVRGSALQAIEDIAKGVEVGSGATAAIVDSSTPSTRPCLTPTATSPRLSSCRLRASTPSRDVAP